MKRTIQLVLWLHIMATPAFSQQNIGQELITELSASYVWDYDDNGFGILSDELSFSPSFSVNITNRWHAGLRSYVVRNRGKIAPQFQSWHFLIGPTIKYVLLQKNGVAFSLGTAYYYGNHCPNCTPTDEFYDMRFHYLGVDANLDFRVHKAIPPLWVHLSFSSNNILNAKGLNGYNLPLIGLQYRIGEKYKRGN